MNDDMTDAERAYYDQEVPPKEWDQMTRTEKLIRIWDECSEDEKDTLRVHISYELSPRVRELELIAGKQMIEVHRLENTIKRLLEEMENSGDGEEWKGSK
jgi:hypothetical protein